MDDSVWSEVFPPEPQPLAEGLLGCRVWQDLVEGAEVQTLSALFPKNLLRLFLKKKNLPRLIITSEVKK